jgi:hypothetical protein
VNSWTVMYATHDGDVHMRLESRSVASWGRLTADGTVIRRRVLKEPAARCCAVPPRESAVILNLDPAIGQ